MVRERIYQWLPEPDKERDHFTIGAVAFARIRLITSVCQWQADVLIEDERGPNAEWKWYQWRKLVADYRTALLHSKGCSIGFANSVRQ